MLGNKLKEKMGSKGVAVVRLSLWAGVVVWMVFCLTFAISTASWLGERVRGFMTGWWVPNFVDVMVLVIPRWWVFTWLLIIIMVARFVNKRMRG